MRASVHASTHRSARHTDNEDRAVVGTTVLAATARVEHARVSAPVVVAVLDGLGGHPAGDVASHSAARLIAGADPPEDEAAVEALLQRADQAIHAAAREQPTYLGMGTTVALLALTGDGHRLIVANVGDSSVWALGDGSVSELSVSDRGAGGALLQCLGAYEDDVVVPHLSTIEVSPGDRLLLASDGLTDVVPLNEVEAALRTSGDEAAMQLQALVDAAGAPDDVTIVVVEILSTS